MDQSYSNIVKTPYLPMDGKIRINLSVFMKQEVGNDLHKLHENSVLADKASNNIVFVSKSFFCDFLLNELEFTSTSGNSTCSMQSYKR
jgi:tRNA A-37 threonylcarbamoyl transferase component Bud32